MEKPMPVTLSDNLVDQFEKNITRWIPPVVYFDEISQLEVEFINPHLLYDHTTQKHRSHKITV